MLGKGIEPLLGRTISQSQEPWFGDQVSVSKHLMFYVIIFNLIRLASAILKSFVYLVGVAKGVDPVATAPDILCTR